MLHTPHFLAGAAIATQIPDPTVASVAAIASHFVMDAVPHADYLGEAAITPANVALTAVDGVVGLSLFFYLVEPSLWGYAFIIGLMANLPDFIALPAFIWPKWKTLPILKPFLHWHNDVLQYQRELPLSKRSWPYWFWGILPQALLLVALIFIIK